MATIRVAKNKDNPYVMLNKTGLNDDNLSWKSKGILAYLLSKPDDWKCQVTDLTKHSKDGRDSTYAGLRELREHGYMIKRPIKNEKGKIVEWEEVLYETPQEEAKDIFKKQQENRLKGKSKSISVDNVDNVNNSDENEEKEPLTESTDMDKTAKEPLTEKPDMEKPDMEEPDTENPEILITNDLLNNNILINEEIKKEKDSSSDSKWKEVKDKLKEKISESSFKTWIESSIVKVDIVENNINIFTVNDFSKSVLKERYSEMIKSACKSIIEKDLSVNFYS